MIMKTPPASNSTSLALLIKSVELYVTIILFWFVVFFLKTLENVTIYKEFQIIKIEKKPIKCITCTLHIKITVDSLFCAST